jgi:hypothetical protein
LLASREARCNNLVQAKTKSLSTERHASTKYFCLWKSFREKFSVTRDFNRAEKILSSGENVTAARVVQEQPLAFSSQSSAKNLKHRPHSLNPLTRAARPEPAAG